MLAGSRMCILPLLTRTEHTWRQSTMSWKILSGQRVLWGDPRVRNKIKWENQERCRRCKELLIEEIMRSECLMGNLERWLSRTWSWPLRIQLSRISVIGQGWWQISFLSVRLSYERPKMKMTDWRWTWPQMEWFTRVMWRVLTNKWGHLVKRMMLFDVILRSPTGSEPT